MIKYTINFLIRTDKVYSKVESSIILTLSISNQQKKINTSISVIPQMWDNTEKRVIYLSKVQAKKVLGNHDYDKLPYADEIKRMNLHLDDMKLEIMRIINWFEANKFPYSCQKVIEEYKNANKKMAITDDPALFVFDYIDRHVNEFTPPRVKGSMSVYKALKAHLNAYQETQKVKIHFSNIDYNFFQSFQNFLFEHTTDKCRTLNNITIAKRLRTLKTFLSYAKRGGIKINEGYRDFVIKRQKLEVIALTEKEFYKIYKFDLSNNARLERVEDVFCFSCMVGNRYSDLAQLRRYHIKGDAIVLTTKKTKKAIETQLNTIAKTILKKYASDDLPLPVIKNIMFT